MGLNWSQTYMSGFYSLGKIKTRRPQFLLGETYILETFVDKTQIHRCCLLFKRNFSNDILIKVSHCVLFLQHALLDWLGLGKPPRPEQGRADRMLLLLHKQTIFNMVHYLCCFQKSVVLNFYTKLVQRLSKIYNIQKKNCSKVLIIQNQRLLCD